MNTERWVTCPEISKFEISDHGNIRCKATKESRKPTLHKTGYYYLAVTTCGVKQSYKVHRLVAKAFVENPHGKDCVNHKDAVKTNNHYTNLEWCTKAENNQHARELGLVPSLKGELNGRAIINEEVVHKICAMYVDGFSPKQVIEKLGITRNQAIKIKCKTTWKHITSQYNY